MLDTFRSGVFLLPKIPSGLLACKYSLANSLTLKAQGITPDLDTENQTGAILSVFQDGCQ